MQKTSNTFKPAVDHFVSTYGDMIFDLCESMLWNPVASQFAFRDILKKIKKYKHQNCYSTYERSWVLRVACERLLKFHTKDQNLSPEDQIKLDANVSFENRLKSFNFYFHRLRPTQQILLLLRDKYNIPFSEISVALAAPEASLKIQRQQALSALEEWLWNSK